MGWNITRGNHARQPHSSSPKWREFALLVLKIRLFFLLIQVFSGIIQHLYTARGIRRNLTLKDDHFG